MALNENGGDFLHRWYIQEGEVLQWLPCLWYLLISLELFLLLKSSTIEWECYLARNSLGKLACKYPVFSFTIIAWTVWSCWSAIPFFLVVRYGDYIHPATLFLTWTLSQLIPFLVDPMRPNNVQGKYLIFFYCRGFRRPWNCHWWNFFRGWSSYEIQKVDACHPIKPALFCSSDQSTLRTLTNHLKYQSFLVLIFDLE